MSGQYLCNLGLESIWYNFVKLGFIASYHTKTMKIILLFGKSHFSTKKKNIFQRKYGFINKKNIRHKISVYIYCFHYLILFKICITLTMNKYSKIKDPHICLSSIVFLDDNNSFIFSVCLPTFALSCKYWNIISI